MSNNDIAQKVDDLNYFRYASFYVLWGLVNSQVPAEAYGRVTLSLQGRLEFSNNTTINLPSPHNKLHMHPNSRHYKLAWYWRFATKVKYSKIT